MIDKPTPIVAHLEELRTRLIKSLIAVFVFSLIAYAFSATLMDQLAEHAGKLVFLKPAEAFIVRIKISFFAGAFVSLPILIYQAWKFISLGLMDSERRIVLRFVPLSFILFLAGATLAWFVIVPMAVSFLLSFGTESLQPYPRFQSS